MVYIKNFQRINSKKSDSFNYIIFRMFNVYGPGQDLLNEKQNEAYL